MSLRKDGDVRGGGVPTRRARVVSAVAILAVCAAICLRAAPAFAYYPTSSISGIPATWTAGDVTFTLTSDSSEAQIQYWIDGDPTGDIYYLPVTITADGYTYVEYACHDGHSLREDPHYATILIDKSAPVTSVTGAPTGWTTPGTYALHVTPGDAYSGVAATYYRIDDGPPQLLAGTTVSVTSTRTTWVDCWSVDRVGNVEVPKTTVIHVDGGLPATTLSGLPGTPWGWTSSPVIFSLAGESPSGPVASTIYRLGSGPLTVFSGPVTFSTEGATPLAFSSVDAVGAREPTRTVMLDIDYSPPVSWATGLPGGPTPSNVTFALAGSDALSGLAAIDYSLDGAATVPYVAPVTLAAGADTSSTHTLTWWAVDRAGNAEAAHSSSIQLDTRLPITTLSGAPSGWVSGDVTFVLSAFSPGYQVSGTYYRFGSGAVHAYTSPVVVSSLEATTVSFWSQDSQGQIESPQSRTLLIDRIAPVSTASGIPGGASPVPVTFTLQGSDTGSGLKEIRYRLGSGSVAVYAGPVTVSSPGLTTVTWWAVDWAGNAEAPHAATADIESGGVATSISGVPPGWSRGDVTFSLEAQGDASGGTYYRVGAQPLTGYAAPVTISSEGTTDVSWYSVNGLGVAEPLHTAQVRIDRTPPVTTSDVATSYPGAATIHLSASDALSGVAGTTWSLDGGVATSGTVVQVSTSGTHTVTYASTDVAGNGEAPHGDTFTVGGASAPSALTIAVTPKSVALPRPFALSGILSHGVVGDLCVVEVRKPGSARWSYSSARGAYQASPSVVAWWYRYTPKLRGTYTFRVRFAGGAGRAPTVSGTVSVRVR